MKITYIYHSCFSVELDTCILLFDYYTGKLPSFDKNKNLYVFSSHSHGDHYSTSIFNLEKNHPNTIYILSDDISVPKAKNVHLIGANDTLVVDNLKIHTLESSDLGVAFIINVENKVIYHAGDLNWWHWEGENSPEENKYAENLFKTSIDKIKGISIDLAFLPLDPRQCEQYYLGFDYFMRNINTNIAVPMHLWDDYSLINTLKKSNYAKLYKNKIVTINQAEEVLKI